MLLNSHASKPNQLACFLLLSLLCSITLCDNSLSGIPGAELDLELNPCAGYSSSLFQPDCKASPKRRFFFNKDRKACEPQKVSDCGDVSTRGFADFNSCEQECNKKRTARRLPSRSKYEVLSDLQITAPKMLSSSIKRKFPISFCDLQWDSGLICPGEHRGNYIDQFYYDGKSNSCLHFVYNGCGGNANRFFSLWECIQSCVRRPRQHSSNGYK